MLDTCKIHTKGDGSWWAYDARGIELCRVCEKCEQEKLAGYRPEVLDNPYYEADDLGDDDPDYEADDIKDDDIGDGNPYYEADDKYIAMKDTGNG